MCDWWQWTEQLQSCHHVHLSAIYKMFKYCGCKLQMRNWNIDTPQKQILTRFRPFNTELSSSRALPGIPCSHSLFLSQAFPLEPHLGAGLYFMSLPLKKRVDFCFFGLAAHFHREFPNENFLCPPPDAPSWPTSPRLWAQEMPHQLFPASQFSLHLVWWHLLGSSPLSSALAVFSVLPILALLVLNFPLHPFFLIRPSLAHALSGIPFLGSFRVQLHIKFVKENFFITF